MTTPSQGNGWFYGGPGDDLLYDDTIPATADMWVGGPGEDLAWIVGDGQPDVVRLRGGGEDRLDCNSFPPPDPEDVFYVDRSDRIHPDCRKSRIVLDGRRGARGGGGAIRPGAACRQLVSAGKLVAP